jgi:hypothetical protein
MLTLPGCWRDELDGSDTPSQGYGADDDMEAVERIHEAESDAESAAASNADSHSKGHAAGLSEKSMQQLPVHKKAR